jgi:glycosyltransferase involved in cell wall biosynthesis
MGNLQVRSRTNLVSKTVIVVGSYDRGKPRVRLLLAGARLAGYQIVECHGDIWAGTEDKSSIRGITQLGIRLLRWMFVYPRILWRYVRAPKHTKVLVPYPGVLDIIFLYPVIKSRGAKIYWDVFFSIYDTVVNDRKLVRRRGAVAIFLYAAEWLTARLVDVVFLDTQPHARYFATLFNLPFKEIGHVPVGVETNIFQRRELNPWQGERPLRVLFYGQFSPLQGTRTLLEAIVLWEHVPQLSIEWIIIGRGQDADAFDKGVSKFGLSSVQRIEWVPYTDLANWIAKADICCGIFGCSDKALNVIPNKAYQVLGVGRPIITADTPGIRSILKPGPAVELVAPEDSGAIVEGIARLATRLRESRNQVIQHINVFPVIGPKEVGDRLASLLD